MKKILVVEDEIILSSLIKEFLEINNFNIIVANNGYDAIKLHKEENPDIVILDLNLPDMFGVDVCKKIRETDNNIPICILSANMNTVVIVEALNEGADDYLTKPFSNQELLARINALFRRYNIERKEILSEEETGKYKIADLEVDLKSFSVKRANKNISLTNKEFMLLEFLCRNQNKILTRGVILRDVWNIDFDTHTNIIDVHISWLRKKLGIVENAEKLIHTISGKGYMFGVLN